MHTPSWIEIEEMVNVRDVGGLPTGDGHLTRPGVLYRGEHPDDLSPAGVAHVVDVLGLRLVVDLRMAPEREGRSSPLTEAGVDVWTFPMYEDPRTTSGMRTALPEAEGALAMGEYYLTVLERFQDRSTRLLDRLVAGGTPAFIHCAAGKDRTGMVVAMLLGAANVEPESIIADYAATEIRLDRLLARLARTLGEKEAGANYPAHVLRAHPATMRFVVDNLIERHGSLRQWWLDGGTPPATLDQWNAIMVAD